tara:strand:+ start:850 stop:1566 length:717 start_codon:yes stop_codon:yes gene_type:complete
MINTISSIIRWVIFFPILIIGLLIMIILSFFNLKMVFWFSKPFCWLLALTIGAKVTVEGNFPVNEKFVVMSNHSSFFDPFIYPFFMKGMFTGIVADYNLKFPLWKQFLLRLNAIPINRKDRNQAIQGIKKAEEVLNRGINIAILPEGTRTINGKLGKLKKGGFHLAMNTKASIIPIGIKGAFKLAPKTTWKLTPCEIIAKVGDPIPFSVYEPLGVDGLLQKVERDIKILSSEIKPDTI